MLKWNFNIRKRDALHTQPRWWLEARGHLISAASEKHRDGGRAMAGVAERPSSAGVCPLVKMGKANFYANHEGRGRICELNWANAKSCNPDAKY